MKNKMYFFADANAAKKVPFVMALSKNSISKILFGVSYLKKLLPFVFSALSMNAVGKAAMSMIEEVRRQFKELPKLKAALKVMRKYDSDLTKASKADMKIFNEADGVAEYSKCVEISTQAALREMILPGFCLLYTSPSPRDS